MGRLLHALVLGGLISCTSDTETDTETDADTDADTDTDTDDQNSVVWIDRTIETATTLNAVYTGGTGAWVFGDSGMAWKIAQGTSTELGVGLEDDLRGVWGQGDGGAESIVVVGYSGTVLSVSGDATIEQEDLGTANLNAVDGGVNDLIAVGRAGIHRYEDGQWSFESSGDGGALNDVYVGPMGTFAVGEEATILEYKNEEWVRVATNLGITTHFHGIDGDDQAVWVVGEKGRIAKYDGDAWSLQDSGVSANLWAIWVDTSGVPFIVGTNGTALRGSDEGFESMLTGVSNNLYGIWGSASDNVWAVGNRGTVLRYTGQ